MTTFHDESFKPVYRPHIKKAALSATARDMPRYPSDIPIPVCITRFGRVAILICFDRHYPECWQAIADLGADLVLIPTGNIKDEPLEKWFSLVQNSNHPLACGKATVTAITYEHASFPHDVRDKVAHGAELGLERLQKSRK